MLSAIILAGASAENFGCEAKSRAMIKVGGTTMLDRVASALSGTDEIIAVGDVESDLVSFILPPKNTLMENLAAAFKKAKGDYILLCTSDIPFVNRKCIEDFVKEGYKLKADFVYPICDRKDCIKVYPILKRTYVKIKEGEFTGGNVMLMKRDFLEKILPLMQELYEARKSPLKLAKMIGFDVIGKLILSRIFPNVLDIAFLEKKISGIFGAEARALIVRDPSICEDLDSPEELEKFEKIIGADL